ncbi:MAG: hypothetical protein ACJAWW_002736 [Sulfurimonas sp.]
MAYSRYLYSPKDTNNIRDSYMEDKLGKIENFLSATIWKDFANGFIDFNHIQTKRIIALFISLLILRNKSNLEKNENIKNFIVKDILKHNPPNNTKCAFIIKEKEYPFDINDEINIIENETKYDKSIFFIENIDIYSKKYMEILLQKQWYIIYSEDKKFITSDKPVISTLGLQTEGTVIIFPISPTRMLIMDDIGKDSQYNVSDEESYYYFNSIIFSKAYQYVISNKDFSSMIPAEI